jgi:signal transduction histidine kinase
VTRSIADVLVSDLAGEHAGPPDTATDRNQPKETPFMRRLSLSTKLFAAALPLVIAVGGLLALTVRSDLDEIARAESGAELGSVWEPLIAALNALEDEADTIVDIDVDSTDVATSAAGVRRATDQALNDLGASIEGLDAFEAASAHVTSGRSALSAARRNIDMSVIAPEMTSDIDPVEAYNEASREFVAVGQLLPSEAGDADLGRELLAVVKLAEARLHASEVLVGTRAWERNQNDNTPLAQSRAAYANLLSTIGEFEAIAPEEWAAQFRQSGFATTLGSYNTELTSVARAADAGRVELFDSEGFDAFIGQGVEFQRTISQSIVDGANAAADSTRSATMRRIGIILAAVIAGAIVAWFITRSVTRRVKAVANSANRVASDQLPALVEALRDPRGKAVLPEIEPVDAKGSDDLADLAHAFNSMQETLIDVAHEQVEVLRRGVSDIFITMARRNRSLIDRQLSMLDEFEASVDDHEVLSNYYQLDHLATRMRRNSESLLVLANAEPKRRRVKATEIDDVVRASIGEVEDYRRIEIQHLESLQVRGNVVADVSHLLAELLDNATSFSPPGSVVRVGGRRADDSYLLRIVDDGVGIGPDRLAELNELLREPPIVGLSVESTLGISVVSLLANKHGISVTLSAGSPGLTVDVVLPSSLFGPMDAPADQPSAPAEVPQQTGEHAGEQMISWDEQQGAAGADPAVASAEPATSVAASTDDALRIPDPSETSEPTTEHAEPAVAAADAASTAPDASDWTKMSLDLSALDTGTPSEPATAATADAPAAVDPIVAPEPAVEPTATPEPAAAASTAPEASDWTKMSLDLSALDTGTPSGPTTASPAGTPAPALPNLDAAPAPAPAPQAEPTTMPEPATASTINLPPPAPVRSEFDVPPAPPVSVNGLAQRPVSPATARPAPMPTPSTDSAPALPTRTQRGTGPDGPDRLAMPLSPNADAPVATSEPGALQAALSAFDSGRAAVNAPQSTPLPTRDRGGDQAPMGDEPLPVSQSRVDPNALRDRLRAFQSEFTNAAGDNTGGTDIYTDQNSDLGGDPR